MGQYVLLLVVALTVGAVVFGVSVLLSGGDPGLGVAEPDGREIPLPGNRPLVEADVTGLRFDTALRGYRMAQVDRALRRAAYDIGYKDELISVLEAEVSALRSGRTADAEALRRAREAALAPVVADAGAAGTADDGVEAPASDTPGVSDLTVTDVTDVTDVTEEADGGTAPSEPVPAAGTTAERAGDAGVTKPIDSKAIDSESGAGAAKATTVERETDSTKGAGGQNAEGTGDTAVASGAADSETAGQEIVADPAGSDGAVGEKDKPGSEASEPVPAGRASDGVRALTEPIKKAKKAKVEPR